MKSSAAYAEKIKKLYAQQKRVKQPAEWPEAESLIEHLMLAVLSDGVNQTKARTALSQLLAATVDLNDLRVSTPQALADLIESVIPNGLPRTSALVRVLNAVFEHENEVSIDRVKTFNKKDRREYLATLDGISPYAATCTMIFGFGDHAIAVEDALLETFKREELIAEDCTAEKAQQFLERQISAGEGPQFTMVMKRYAASKSSRLSTTSPQSKKKKKTVARKG
jgi:endonuclease III